MDGYDLIIPVFKEKNIINLIDYLFKNSKNFSNIIICYDDDNDLSVKIIKKYNYNNHKNIILLKNKSKGPCEAVKTGLNFSTAKSMIVYPADDFNNGPILDKMYSYFLDGYDIVCPSRFINGGYIKNCPLVKYFIVRSVSFFLYYFSNLNVKDPTNGFRLFSKKLIENNNIDSTKGFAYSLELLIKARFFDKKIIEIPAIWIERKDRKSSFKIIEWSGEYLKWFFLAILKKY